MFFPVASPTTNIQFNVSQQGIIAAVKANCGLNCVSKSMDSRSREVIISLYLALMGLHLESCVHFWAPEYKKDISKGMNGFCSVSIQSLVPRCICLLHSYIKLSAQSSAVIRLIQLFFLPVTRYLQEQSLGFSLPAHEQQFHTVNNFTL